MVTSMAFHSSRTYFLLIPHSHRLGHVLVLATQKGLRPDPRIICYGVNGFRVLLFVPAALEVQY